MEGLSDHRARPLKTMTLAAAEFIRRFLIHVLPTGFHRIRHYGLFASPVRAQNVERARQLLATPAATPSFARPDRQRAPKAPQLAPSVSMLRRPDDRDRNLRRRAPRALAIAEPDQDRYLMSHGADSPSQPQSPSTRPTAGTGGRCPLTARRPSPSAELTPRRRQPNPLNLPWEETAGRKRLCRGERDLWEFEGRGLSAGITSRARRIFPASCAERLCDRFFPVR